MIWGDAIILILFLFLGDLPRRHSRPILIDVAFEFVNGQNAFGDISGIHPKTALEESLERFRIFAARQPHHAELASNLASRRSVRVIMTYKKIVTQRSRGRIVRAGMNRKAAG